MIIMTIIIIITTEFVVVRGGSTSTSLLDCNLLFKSERNEKLTSTRFEFRIPKAATK